MRLTNHVQHQVRHGFSGFSIEYVPRCRRDQQLPGFPNAGLVTRWIIHPYDAGVLGTRLHDGQPLW